MKTHDDLNIQEPMAGADAEGNDLHTGSGLEIARAAVSAAASWKKRLAGPEFAPPGLLVFLDEVSVAEAAETLGMSRKQVHRLRSGYWPADSRKVVAAWEAYRGRAAVVASSWFLRRVQCDALVRHGAHLYTGHRLGEHAGRLLALARTVEGQLVAQTLGGQQRMLVLERVEA